MLNFFRRDDLVNKHGQPIHHFSKCPGSTELEKYKNSYISSKDDIEYQIESKLGLLTCIVRYNESSHSCDCGYYLLIFNNCGELIEDTFPSISVEDGSKGSVEEILSDLGLIKR